MVNQKSKYAINREKYKAIKKYDHQQMETFCTSVYESGFRKGYESGCKATADAASTELEAKLRKIISEEILLKIGKVKGIGPKKLEEIRESIGVTAEEYVHNGTVQDM